MRGGRPLSAESWPLSVLTGRVCINQFMFISMANVQRIVVSLLLILTFTFVFFAQSSQAAKGPKITHKVRKQSRNEVYLEAANIVIGVL